MAVGFYAFNSGLSHGGMLRSFLSSLDIVNRFPEILANMAQMINGDGSSATQFDVVTAQFGFPDNTTAKAAWDELNSVNAKLQTDLSVTFVHSAITQALAKFR